MSGRWIETKSMMPKPGIPVLAVQQVEDYRKKLVPLVVIASYIPARHEEYYGDDSEWCDVDEEDNYWLPEGWYEQTWNNAEHTSMQITDEVTHWMHKPDLPELATDVLSK